MRTIPINTTPLMKTLQESLRPNLKELPARIAAKQQPIDTFEKANTYQFVSGEKKIQVVIDKAKSLITDLFTLNANNKCVEEVHYDYNGKGQMIRVNKKGTSPGGKKNSVKTNIAYNGKNIIVSKNVNFGTIDIKTIFGYHGGRKTIDLTVNKNLENRVEQITYVEGKSLESVITQDDVVKFEGFGDPQSGQMVFSRSTLHPHSNMECCELQDNGTYHKQIYFDNFKTVVSRDVNANNADCFVKNEKDMMTPQQELVLILKPLLG